MKTGFTLLIISVTSLSLMAQNQLQLNANNADVTLLDDGTFFNDATNSTPGYEIPKGSGNHTIYKMSFWTIGFESDSTIHAACGGYGGQDFFPGPIADDYNSAHYANTYMNSIWKVTRDQINYHVANFTATGYTPDPSIANWPGNGNTSEGIAAQQAPYVDANNDQIYNPLDGDFPYIQGDMAVFVILNDEAGFHALTGGLAFGIEVHAMFYQYESTDADINNTTFLNAKIFNRRDTNFVDFRFGLFMDTDIGNPTDDYIGSDSARSLAYGYNGDNNDEGTGGQPGYGNNPPAFGAKMLNENAGAITYFNNGSGFPPAPGSIPEYYYYMSAMWNGSLQMNDGTTPTSFVYSGNPFTASGWNEVSEGNTTGDRRLIISSTGKDLNSGESLCFDFAFVFNQETGNALENVNELLNTSDFVQNFYNTTIVPCNQIFLEQQEQTTDFSFSIYPNPSNGNFLIEISEPAILSLYDAAGNIVIEPFSLSESAPINLDLANGIYFLKIQCDQKTHVQKIIVQQ